MAAPRKRLGFFLWRFGGRLQYRLWSGVEQATREQGIDLLCLSSQSEVSPALKPRTLYRRILTENVDAVIILNLAVRELDDAALRAFCDGLGDLPVVLIGRRLPPIPSVCVDNAAGSHLTTKHLIEQHGLRRIAFFGVMDWGEGRARCAGYEQAMREAGLYDPELVLARWQARRAFFERRKRLFSGALGVDGIVAADDMRAVEVMDGLLRHGIQVPRDVAVVGFDNAWHAQGGLPPLSTVEVPLETVAAQAVRIALARLEGQRVCDDTVSVPVEPVIRQSCGCLGERVAREPNHVPARAETSDATAARSAMAAVVPDSARGAEGHIPRLAQAFEDALGHGEHEPFVREFSAVLNASVLAGEDVSVWNDLLGAMRDALLPRLAGTDAYGLAEDLWHQARALIEQSVHSANMRYRRETRGQRSNFDTFAGALTQVTTFPDLAALLGRTASLFGLTALDLVLYDTWADGAAKARVLMSRRRGETVELPETGRVLPDERLLPAELFLKDRRGSLIVAPLVASTRPLGCVVFGTRTPHAQYTRWFPGHIRTALDAILLRQDRETAERELAETTHALLRSNEELEHFAYVASHDLQEPLRNISGFLQLLKRRYYEAFDDDCREFLSFALAGAEQLQALVTSLLEYSRVATRAKPFEPVDGNEVVKWLRERLAAEIVEAGATISHGTLPTVSADLSQFTQVLRHLLSNALKFRGEAAPRIEISAKQEGDDWLFAVSDNGIGIDPAYAERIFGIFFRLHGERHYSGTGIGLAVCKRILERHCGRIWVESEPGKGATFRFTIPRGADGQ